MEVGRMTKNEALAKLDGLVGSWAVTLTDAWFLESPEVRIIRHRSQRRARAVRRAFNDYRGVARAFDMTFMGCLRSRVEWERRGA
jgi:hypothetical protein